MCRPPVMSADHPAASDGGPVVSHTRHPVSDRVPPSRCTSEFWQVCHGAGDPAATRRFTPPSRPRRRPIVQRCPKEGGGDSPVRRPGADGCCASPVAIPRTLPPAVLGAPLPAMLIVRRRRWGPIIGREQRRGQAGDRSPSRPRWWSNSDHAGKSTFSGKIESLDRDPGIATLVPGMRFPGN